MQPANIVPGFERLCQYGQLFFPGDVGQRELVHGVGQPLLVPAVTAFDGHFMGQHELHVAFVLHVDVVRTTTAWPFHGPQGLGIKLTVGTQAKRLLE